MIVAAVALAATSPAQTPRAFMQHLYANYRHANYSPFTHPERIFAPRLLGAINEDAKLAHDEVGYLDGDPLCQCQDTSGMRPIVTGVTWQGQSKATVRVSIGWENDKPQPAKFSLIRTKGGWRIADVSSADQPSLLAALERSNRKLRAKR